MKINFTPIKLYPVNNINRLKNSVSFGEIGEGYRTTEQEWNNSDIFTLQEDSSNIFQDTSPEEHESKFRNLPNRSSVDKIREMAYIDYLSGCDPDDDDFIERLTL